MFSKKQIITALIIVTFLIVASLYFAYKVRRPHYKTFNFRLEQQNSNKGNRAKSKANIWIENFFSSENKEKNIPENIKRK